VKYLTFPRYNEKKQAGFRPPVSCCFPSASRDCPTLLRLRR